MQADLGCIVDDIVFLLLWIFTVMLCFLVNGKIDDENIQMMESK